MKNIDIKDYNFYHTARCLCHWLTQPVDWMKAFGVDAFRVRMHCE